MGDAQEGGAGAVAAADVCEQCGSTSQTQGVLGLQVCGACGAVRSFKSSLRQQTQTFQRQQPLVPKLKLLTVKATSKDLCRNRHIVLGEARTEHRIQRCREAIALTTASVRLQDSVHELALALLVRYCQRTSGVPSKGQRLKTLVGACVLAVSARQGLGLTIHEVAAQAHVPLGHIQRAVWKVCKVNGVRLLRSQANIDALLQRMCDSLQLYQYRGAVCLAATRLISIANQGWVATGRMWAFVVCAALSLALQAYHFHITSEQVAKCLSVGLATVDKRIQEIRKILVSVLRVVPWGHMVTVANVHVYVPFVIDFFDVLAPVAFQTANVSAQRKEESKRQAKEPTPLQEDTAAPWPEPVGDPLQGGPVPPLPEPVGDAPRKRQRRKVILSESDVGGEYTVGADKEQL